MTALSPELLASILRITGGDDLAARRLVRRWQACIAEGEQRAERIRRQVAEARCRCGSTAHALPDGRCSRCFGRAGEASA